MFDMWYCCRRIVISTSIMSGFSVWLQALWDVGLKKATQVTAEKGCTWFGKDSYKPVFEEKHYIQQKKYQNCSICCSVFREASKGISTREGEPDLWDLPFREAPRMSFFDLFLCGFIPALTSGSVFFFFVSRFSHCMCEGWSCCGQHNTRLVGIWWHIWHNFRVWLAHQVFLPQTIPIFHPLAKFPYNASQIAAAVGGGLCVIIFKMRQKI